jgi:hypothetical protein
MVVDDREWYSIIVEQEAAWQMRLLRMSAAEWRAEQTRMLRAWRGRDIRPCLAEIERIDRERMAFAAPRAAGAGRPPRPVPVVAPRRRTEFDLDFAIWKDMIEEPAKYGDDICEWLELNEKLSCGAGRWRLAAYWLEKEAEEKAKEEALVAPWKALYSECAKEAAVAGERRWIQSDIKRFVNRIRNAAVTIQAAVRGYQARSKQPFRDCCMCLSHRICPLQTDVGMMCRACAEQGPYDEETGPVADPWSEFRADFVDLAPGANAEEYWFYCGFCETATKDGAGFCDEHCQRCYERGVGKERCAGCGKVEEEGSMDHASGYGYYCTRKCGPAGWND